MIVVEYTVDPSKPYSALIGKGVTFDTGGVNIKPTGFVEDMFIDKGGACAVFAAFKRLVNMKVNHNLVMCIPLAENSCSGKSYRPSDVIKSH